MADRNNDGKALILNYIVRCEAINFNDASAPQRRTHMRSRIEYIKAAPGLLKAIQPLDNYVRKCGLEDSLIDLVLIRASQINGCAYCIDMHTKDARA